LKVRRHDANNGGGLAVDPNGLADNVWVPVEIAFPNFVAKYCDLLRSRFVIFDREVAAEDRLHVYDLEEVFRTITTRIALRVFLIGNVDRRAVEICRHEGKGLLAGTQILIIL